MNATDEIRAWRVRAAEAMDGAGRGAKQIADAFSASGGGVRCERCGTDGNYPPTLAWLGRHAHGTQTVGYFRRWKTEVAL